MSEETVYINKCSIKQHDYYGIYNNKLLPTHLDFNLFRGLLYSWKASEPTYGGTNRKQKYNERTCPR